MNTPAKDNFSFSAGVNGLGNVGFSTADNSLTCDSQGNCMLKDQLRHHKEETEDEDDTPAARPLTTSEIIQAQVARDIQGSVSDNLAAKDNFSFSAGIPGLGNVGFSTADKKAKDNFSIGGSFGGMSAGISFADNSLTCDSQGNCMLKDKLFCMTRKCVHEKEAAAAAAAPQTTSDMIAASVAKQIQGSVNLAAKDNFSFNAGVKGLGNVGFSTADNSLTCDSAGNCMLKDKLAAKDNFSFSAGIPGLGNVGFSTADKKAKDNFSIGGSFGGMSAGIKFADNALTCDSQGNCTLGDFMPAKSNAQIQADLMAKGRCPARYEWKKVSGGWRCSAGGHYMSDAQVAAM